MGIELPDALLGLHPRHHLAVNTKLPNTAHDELRVLTAKVNDKANLMFQDAILKRFERMVLGGYFS